MAGGHADPADLLFDSVKIYSPSSAEGEYASFLLASMKDLGYRRVRSDSAGNVLGETGSGPTSLLLCGHMDTVPGRLPVRRTRTHVFGRGASDAKAALCALLVAGSRASDCGVKVTFAGATREETDSLGVHTIVRNGRGFDYAVFGEPSGAGRIALGYRGRVGMRVTLTTKGGHAGAPWANGSAFDGFLLLLSKLKEFESSVSVVGDRFRSISVSPTVIRAGAHHNVIPATCDATFDVRLPPGVPAREAVASLRRAAADIGDGVKVKVAFDEASDAYEAPRDSVLVRAFQRAIILRMKTRPIFTRKTGTGDMNYFAARTRSTCVTYGPGQPETSHSDGESVQIRDYLDSIDVLTEAVAQLGRLSASGKSGRSL
jgi:LysW-gamma-L-lysine carboxypeptidase